MGQQHGSVDRDLQAFAREAALSLDVPFVTISLDATHDKTLFVDGIWASEHGDIDVAALDNANAVEQNIPFFACVPIRGEEGETVGTLCCGDSDQRDLAEDEIGRLKSVAAQVAARLQAEDASPLLARH